MVACRLENMPEATSILIGNPQVRNFDRNWLILNQKSFVGEKGTAGRAQALFEKYERKVVDSYEKQIKKLESTYKAIFASLEAHKATQINQLRTLQL